MHELVTGVIMALNGAALPSCATADSDGSGPITINELVTAVANALGGCP